MICNRCKKEFEGKLPNGVKIKDVGHTALYPKERTVYPVEPRYILCKECYEEFIEWYNEPMNDKLSNC